ncbi:hypothetical protein Brsp01_43640 [Brucella sp. NBRC 12950]|nr:hypothetical protein Brsp01_43640 [Brucella sp. NBRC 12950]
MPSIRQLGDRYAYDQQAITCHPHGVTIAKCNAERSDIPTKIVGTEETLDIPADETLVQTSPAANFDRSFDNPGLLPIGLCLPFTRVVKHAGGSLLRRKRKTIQCVRA